MIKNVVKTIDYLCKWNNIDISVSNAENFIMSIGEKKVSKNKQKLNNFGRIPCAEYFRSIRLPEDEDFIKYYAHMIGWETISKLNLSEKFMIENQSKLHWITMSNYRSLTESIMEQFADKLDWDPISSRVLSEEFIILNCDRFNWILLSRNPILSESLMEQLADKLNWKLASFNQKMSEPFMEKHASKLDWQNISMSKRLSREFILKYEDKLDMRYVLGVSNIDQQRIMDSIRDLY